MLCQVRHGVFQSYVIVGRFTTPRASRPWLFMEEGACVACQPAEAGVPTPSQALQRRAKAQVAMLT
jgi:hypothetical protein